ncbi:hypothetical protein P5673_020055, partial [Acropora cervicornis]
MGVNSSGRLNKCNLSCCKTHQRLVQSPLPQRMKRQEECLTFSNRSGDSSEVAEPSSVELHVNTGLRVTFGETLGERSLFHLLDILDLLSDADGLLGAETETSEALAGAANVLFDLYKEEK